MVIKIVEDRAGNHKDRCEYIAREIFDTYGNENPEYDVIDDAIEILASSNISNDLWQTMEEYDFSPQTVYEALVSLNDSELNEIENKLTKISRGYIKYADVDKSNAYDDYLQHLLQDY